MGIYKASYDEGLIRKVNESPTPLIVDQCQLKFYYFNFRVLFWNLID